MLRRLARLTLRLGLAAGLLFAVYSAYVVGAGIERTEALQSELESELGSALTLADLGTDRIHALLQVEDPSFRTHHGIDLTTPGAGWTTLTQGLVKIHYFDDFQPGWAKVEQSILALVLDAKMPKDDQLTLFLASARFGSHEGRPVAGFTDAARTYFGRPVDELTREEFLSLVAMLVGPNHFHVLRHPERNAERVRRIEALLAGRCQPTSFRDVYLEGCTA